MSSSQKQITTLQACGLHEYEAKILICLNDCIPRTISAIASDTALHRPAIYKYIKTLLEKDLVVTTTKQKRVLYQFAGMHRFKTWRDAQDRALNDFLMTTEKVSKNNPIPLGDVRQFRGKNLCNIWNHVLEHTTPGSSFYRYDAYSPDTSVQSFMPKDFYNRLEKKRLQRFVITNHTLRHTPYKKDLVCASRMLPKNIGDFEQGVTQFIYDDYIAMIDIHTQSGYIIHNPSLATFYAALFYATYNALPE